MAHYKCRLLTLLTYFTCCAENEEDDADFEDGKKEGRRRRTGVDRERSLPPLLARVNGQIEV